MDVLNPLNPTYDTGNYKMRLCNFVLNAIGDFLLREHIDWETSMKVLENFKYSLTNSRDDSILQMLEIRSPHNFRFLIEDDDLQEYFSLYNEYVYKISDS